jgi:tetratricopeptide (TPR) repeat protein
VFRAPHSFMERPWRVTLAGAVASLVFGTFAFIPNAYSTSDVEDCDRTLGPTRSFDFSGTFDGTVVDGGQSSAAAQLKFVRNGNALKGSYLRAEICGSVAGEVILDRLEFIWEWAGNSGHGIAAQTPDGISGAFGLGDAKVGGTFVFIQRQAGGPPADLPPQRLLEASDLNRRAIELDNAGRYADAEPLYKLSLVIREKALGPDHPDVAVSLNNVAGLYSKQGHYAEAEPLYNRSLAIKESLIAQSSG